MRSMETLLDANRAISNDLPAGYLKRAHWLAGAKFGVPAPAVVAPSPAYEVPPAVYGDTDGYYGDPYDACGSRRPGFGGSAGPRPPAAVPYKNASACIRLLRC